MTELRDADAPLTARSDPPGSATGSLAVYNDEK